jgi:phage shock protein A
MGLINRFSSIVKQKVNTMLNKFEDPREALDYSYEKQRELLIKLRRDIAEVITAKKRLEMQKRKLMDTIYKLEEQAKKALDMNREDLARLALKRKNMNLLQLQEINNQIKEMEREQIKLEDTERRLAAKVEEFKLKKEVIKARYSAAKAEVKVKESVTGISEEMADVGLAMQRAEEKVENMKAKSEALDEMLEVGVLEDYTSSKDDIERELEKVSIDASIEEELARLKKKKKVSKEVE